MRHPPIRPGVLITYRDPDSGLEGAFRVLDFVNSGMSVRLRPLGRRGQPPAAAGRRPDISLKLSAVDWLCSTEVRCRVTLPLYPEETKESYE